MRKNRAKIEILLQLLTALSLVCSATASITPATDTVTQNLDTQGLVSPDSADYLQTDDDAYEYVYDEAEKFTEDPDMVKRDQNSREESHGCKKKDGTIIPVGPPRLRTKNIKLRKTSGADVGHSHDLFCPYDSCPTARVVWTKEAGGTVEVVRRRGFSRGQSEIKINRKGDRLRIINNRQWDDGIYVCNITNKFGSISHKIKVQSSVAPRPYPPVIKEALENRTVLVGENVSLTCLPSSSDNLQDTTWYRHYQVNGSYMNDKDEGFVTPVETLHNYKLDLVNLQVNDSTFYSCMIKNQFGSTHSTAFINVVESFDEDLPVSVGQPVWLIVVLAVISVLFLFVLGMCIHQCRKTRRSELEKKEAMENALTVAAWTKKVIVSRDLGEDLLEPLVRIEKIRIEKNGTDSGCPVSEYEFPLDINWEFPRDLLTFTGLLGEGAFGKVVKATAARAEIMNGHLVESSAGHAGDHTVAVKMVKEGHTDSDITDLVKEMEIMKVIGRHPNIINLVGVCSQPIGSPLYVIVEYARHGNLREFLKQRKPGTQEHLKEQRLRKEQRKTAARQHGSAYYINTNNQTLAVTGLELKAKSVDVVCETGPVSLKMMLSFALQVAKGMEFLSSRRAVHRDLAARNVLVADNFVLKIADFGMARDLQDSEYYRKESGGRLPIKWMAPESLFNCISTTMSDVWSFGVLFWEIVTFGDIPYKQEYNPKLFMELIKDGYKMKQPLGCPDNVYAIMKKCWEYQPENRPGWSQLVDSVYNLHINTNPDEYLDLNAPELDTPPSSPDLSNKQASHLATTRPLPISESHYVIPDSQRLAAGLLQSAHGGVDQQDGLPRTGQLTELTAVTGRRSQRGQLTDRRRSRSEQPTSAAAMACSLNPAAARDESLSPVVTRPQKKPPLKTAAQPHPTYLQVELASSGGHNERGDPSGQYVNGSFHHHHKMAALSQQQLHQMTAPHQLGQQQQLQQQQPSLILPHQSIITLQQQQHQILPRPNVLQQQHNKNNIHRSQQQLQMSQHQQQQFQQLPQQQLLRASPPKGHNRQIRPTFMKQMSEPCHPNHLNPNLAPFSDYSASRSDTEASRSDCEELRPLISSCRDVEELRGKRPSTLSVDAATPNCYTGFDSSPQTPPPPPPPSETSIIYTDVRVRTNSVLIRPEEEEGGRATKDKRFSTFLPGLKRGSSESGYGTNRDSESSDTKYLVLPEPDPKVRRASDSDSVFLRDSPSPPSD